MQLTYKLDNWRYLYIIYFCTDNLTKILIEIHG